MADREPVIVGVAETPLENGVVPGGLSPLQITAFAAKAAVEEAGLSLDDVDGLLTAGMWGNPGAGALPGLTLSEYLNIYPRFTDSTNGFRAIRLSLFDDERIDLDQDGLDDLVVIIDWVDEQFDAIRINLDLNHLVNDVAWSNDGAFASVEQRET